MRTAIGLVAGFAVSLAAGSASAAEPTILPADLIDLSPWRLTLPVDTDRPGNPDEIRRPALDRFVEEALFFVGDPIGGSTAATVRFRAPCGGATTRGSRYPRSELRETQPGGEQADWSTADDATHTMTLRAAIVALPPKKRHVVCAQIHDADDDLLMVRLEGTKLFIERNDLDEVMLDRRYALGTPFDIRIVAGHGRVQVDYNGERALDWAVDRDGCYFKAGCYTQSNLKSGDAPESFAEVAIESLRVTHRTDGE